jgi:hypothetical protein
MFEEDCQATSFIHFQAKKYEELEGAFQGRIHPGFHVYLLQDTKCVVLNLICCLT